MSSGNARGEVVAVRRPQRQRGRDRVAGLLAGAAAVFAEKGFEAATMTEIAARAGASIGSLYLFFPTKAVLAQGLLAELADELSGLLDGVQARCAGMAGAAMADALFDVLAVFLTAHPAYAVLIDLRGDEAWRQAVRARRRSQIAALFAAAVPGLAAGMPERLGLLVPEMMRTALVLGGVADAGLREALLGDLRGMLRRHLEAG